MMDRQTLGIGGGWRVNFTSSLDRWQQDGGIVVPVRFQQLNTSELLLTVKAGENAPAKFDLMQ